MNKLDKINETLVLASIVLANAALINGGYNLAMARPGQAVFSVLVGLFLHLVLGMAVLHGLRGTHEEKPKLSRSEQLRLEAQREARRAARKAKKNPIATSDFNNITRTAKSNSPAE